VEKERNSSSGGDGENFAWTRLEAVNTEHLIGDHTFEVFLVQTKTDTEIGHLAANDPVSFFREHIPEIALDRTMSVQVLRVNAEVAFNPVRKSAVWMVYPERSAETSGATAVGVEFKYES
jgi:hypothetical protein